MSTEQLIAFEAVAKEDEGRQEKLKLADDIAAVLAIAKEAGFNVDMADYNTRDTYIAFQAAAKDDEGLQNKLKAAADIDAVLAIAKEAGFDVDKAYLRQVLDELEEADEDDVELSMEQLQQAAGGFFGAVWNLWHGGYRIRTPWGRF